MTIYKKNNKQQVQQPQPQAQETFAHLLKENRGDFLLHFYTAVYRLLWYIQGLSRVGGDSMDEVFKKYQFLSGYFEEIRRYMPAEITWDNGLSWWKNEIVNWEEQIPHHLPLRTVRQQKEFSLESVTVLLLVGLVEEDSRFGTLFEQLQSPLSIRRPCLEMVSQVISYQENGSRSDPWAVLGPLISASLLEVVNKELPRSEWVLRVPTVLWSVIRDQVPTHPAPWCEFRASETLADIDTLIFPTEFVNYLHEVPRLVREGKAHSIVLRGSHGSDRIRTAEALAKAMGNALIQVEGKAMDNAQNDSSTLLMGPLCTMTNALPLMTYDMDPGETQKVPELIGFNGPYIIVTGFEGGLKGRAVEKALTLSLPKLDSRFRKQCWQAAVNGQPFNQLDSISRRFRIPGNYIRQAATLATARAALERRETITMADVRHACRGLNRQMLDTLAEYLEVSGTWNQLIVNPVTSDKLLELETRCRYRERLFENLGPAFGDSKNTGVRVLFSGASGTGKTLAAKILAAELGMDLYRVDLAAVVNKYIGETEKNLHSVLTRAEELDVILLLDEGDALLGTRTDVKTANDRYANLETNYLLQKLEHYQGIVLVTSNAAENIDKAFQRRMDVVVGFVPPHAEERLLIWKLHLPNDHMVSPATLEDVSVRCVMTGGQIRNAALNAALLAVSAEEPVADQHLMEAVRNEYRKAGAMCPMIQVVENRSRQNSMDAFLDTFK